MARLAIVILVVALASFASAAKWAVLVAGSNGYNNYRHQADVSHAYQICKKAGIPEENIITMMYDDIAQNSQNPRKGEIINRPNGEDVYKGVVIDYKGKDTTADNFLKVLQGKPTGCGTGKVLKSTEEDEIFINYSDHGATGLIAMPVGGYVYAKDLIKAFNYMHDNKMYKRILFYLEACESGSMFDKVLPKDINIYATTAANPTESSYAYYYDSKIRAYLGDHYSISWMESCDKQDLSTYTIHEQFVEVRNRVNTSHVMEYGDVSISESVVGDFIGSGNGVSAAPLVAGEYVSQHDAVLEQLSRRLKEANSQNSLEAKELQNAFFAEVNSRKMWQARMKMIVRKVAGQNADEMMSARNPADVTECIQTVVEAVEESCGQLSDYAMQFVRYLNNMCVSSYQAEDIVKAARQVCRRN